MKKNINIFLCLIISFLLVGCGGYKGELYKDNNNNYKSSDVDDNGEIINKKTDKSTSFSDINEYETSNEETEYNIENFKLKAYFIDVGNADCTLFILPYNETLLIDGGNNGDGKDICTYLKRLGVEKINYLIGTHPHEDHIGGLDEVIKNFDVDMVYLPKIPEDKVPSTKTYEDLLIALEDKNTFAINPFNQQIIYDTNNILIDFLSNTDEIDSSNMNDYSLVVKIKYKDISFILQGDAEENIEEMILNNHESSYLDCDILKVGHHGSNTSSSRQWVEALTPKYAYIPCGKDNQYGHPHSETLEKFNEYNIEYFRADIDGTVLVTTDGKNIDIEKNMTGSVPLGSESWNESMIK